MCLLSTFDRRTTQPTVALFTTPINTATYYKINVTGNESCTPRHTHGKKKNHVRFLCEKGAYNVVGQLSSIILRTDDGAFERKK